ncbi:phage tail tape measure protein [Rhizobium sp. 0TCS1.26]|uniref:phage tail tape measure protein n=1 Tax=Rhizobium sp. 0TCS1.26 TaxID=3142623 RepID=UPI003D2BA62B
MASTTHESRLKITLLEDVTRKARGIGAALGGIEKQASSFGAPMRSMVGQALAFGGAYLGVSEGLKATAGSAIAFESAFADVRKVVDANEEQFDNMRRTIRQMSTELPIAANDIAALFAAAGESGVATGDLKSFSEMAARVGIAFDMSAGEAGESLAKLKTQLGLTVGETGDMADAINHLSNNMASKAKDITNYMLRVGALAEMGGFTKEQIAGIGSAMIAAGAEAETAGTAMQNVVKALTKGDSAKKSQREVAEALGLNLPQIAKDMQKDAPKALRKVLTAIGKAPKDRHIALLSDFFGDEAKAFAPLIGNMGLLEQALDSVGDKTKYSGSAFREYVERSKTAANVLTLLGNKVSNVFWGMGDRMLPSIKEAASGIGFVLDTLDTRVTIFDRLETSIKGFSQGLGYSGIREMVEGLGNLLAGASDKNAADEMGRIFLQAREWGASIRELNDAIAANPIAQFFADLAPYGLQLMVWGLGIAFLAGTVRKLAGALMLLSGASTVLAALNAVKGIADVVNGKGAPAGKGRGGGAAAGQGGNSATSKPGEASGRGNSFGILANALNSAALMWQLPSDAKGLQEFVDGNRQRSEGWNAWLEKNVGSPKSWWSNYSAPAAVPTNGSVAIQDAVNARAAGFGGTTDNLPGKTKDDVGYGEPRPLIIDAVSIKALSDQLRLPDLKPLGSVDAVPDGGRMPDRPTTIDAASIDAMTQPRGTQDVNVTNPPARPIITISLGGVQIHGVTDPHAIADKVAPILGQRLRDEVAGIYADTGHGAA